MLLDEEQTRDLVNQIIAAAKTILTHIGVKKVDPATGFEHIECHIQTFVMIEHQRQTVDGGTIKTNGLDIWEIYEGNARKLLSVNYMPFDIRFFYKSGKAPWIQTLIQISQQLAG